MPATIPTIYSTLFLTILLFFGLISFLRGSIRDRTTDALFAVGELTDDRLLMQVRDHFRQRAYKVVELDPERDIAILAGQVKPSLFLAIFLMFGRWPTTCCNSSSRNPSKPSCG